MNFAKIDTIRTAIEAHRGQMFTVEFTKKDGTLRRLNGQLGFREGHDGENTVSHMPEYLTVNENKIDPRTGKRAFRNVNLSSVSYLAVGGMKIYAA